MHGTMGNEGRQQQKRQRLQGNTASDSKGQKEQQQHRWRVPAQIVWHRYCHKHVQRRQQQQQQQQRRLQAVLANVPESHGAQSSGSSSSSRSSRRSSQPMPARNAAAKKTHTHDERRRKQAGTQQLGRNKKGSNQNASYRIHSRTVVAAMTAFAATRCNVAPRLWWSRRIALDRSAGSVGATSRMSRRASSPSLP